MKRMIYVSSDSKKLRLRVQAFFLSLNILLRFLFDVRDRILLLWPIWWDENDSSGFGQNLLLINLSINQNCYRLACVRVCFCKCMHHGKTNASLVAVHTHTQSIPSKQHHICAWCILSFNLQYMRGVERCVQNIPLPLYLSIINAVRCELTKLLFRCIHSDGK